MAPQLQVGRPVLDGDLGHREVADVGSGQVGADPDRRGCDQAVRLVQGHPARRIFAPPGPRPCPLADSQRGDAKCVEEPQSRSLLTEAKAPPDLFSRKGADPRFGPGPAQTDEPRRRRPSAQRVDHHGRVQQQPAHPLLPGSPLVPSTLHAHPLAGIVVPVVTVVRQLTDRRFDLAPASFVVHAASDELSNESAPSARADPAIELDHQVVVQGYVHSYGPSLAHTDDRDRVRVVAGPPPYQRRPVVSAKRTGMHVVPAHVVGGPEAGDPRPHLLLESFERREPRSVRRQMLQIVGDKGAERLALLGGANPCPSVHVVGNRHRDVFHRITVSPIQSQPRASAIGGTIRKWKRPPCTCRTI